MKRYSFKGVLVFLSVSVSCGAFFFCISCATTNNRYLINQNESSSPISLFHFELEKYDVDNGPSFEFAIDGSSYILVYEEYQEPSARGLVVLNMRGEVVDQVKDDEGFMKSEFVSLFSFASNRQYHQRYPKFFMENNTPGSPIKKVDAWKFSRDGNYCVRLFRDTLTRKWRGELWAFSGKPQILWKIENITKGGLYPLIDYISYKGQKSILIAFEVEKVFVLSQEDGSILDFFEYGPKDTEEVLKQRAQKLNISCREGLIFCDLDFSAAAVSYNENKRLVAVGDGHSQRVRIIELDSPHRMILEMNSDCNPYRPRGGIYHVNDLKFTENGKYLVAKYEFQGLETSITYDSTDIYDTDTWECCWFKNTEEIRGVTLSPDGQKIAYRRGNILEVGEFKPEPGSCGEGCKPQYYFRTSN